MTEQEFTAPHPACPEYYPQMYSSVGAALAVGVWREQRRRGMKKLLPNQIMARRRSALSDGGKGRLAGGGGWFYGCGVCAVQ
jgi:hypothetical protein